MKSAGVCRYSFSIRPSDFSAWPVTRNSTRSSMIAPLTPPVYSCRPPLPMSTSAKPSSVFVGRLVSMTIAPPMALRPYSAPCGPLSTSMRWTSKRFIFNCFWLAWGTPSTTTATGESPLLIWLTPRIETNELA